MATVAQMREGLATNLLRAIEGVQVSAYVLAKPTPPAVHVVPSTVDYHQAMGNGLEICRFVVQAFLAAGLAEAAQIRLDEFIDSGAVLTAIESDKTLGGTVASFKVTGMTGYNGVIVEGTEMFSADFEVLVYV